MSRRLSFTLIGLLAFVLAALGLYWSLSTPTPLPTPPEPRPAAESQAEREPGAGEAGGESEAESEAESAAPAQDDSVPDGESPAQGDATLDDTDIAEALLENQSGAPLQGADPEEGADEATSTEGTTTEDAPAGETDSSEAASTEGTTTKDVPDQEADASEAGSSEAVAPQSALQDAPQTVAPEASAPSVTSEPEASDLAQTTDDSGDSASNASSSIPLAGQEVAQDAQGTEERDRPQAPAASETSTSPDDTVGERDTPSLSEGIDVVEDSDAARNPDSPRFDTVRVNPRGTFVAAGTALPYATVNLYANGVLLGSETADARGEWVFVQSTALPSGELVLTLDALSPNGVLLASSQTLLSFLPARDGDSADSAPVTVLLDENLGSTEVLQGGTSASASAPPASGLVETAGEGGARVLIQAIDYTASGEVAVVGQGQAGAQIRLFLDDQLLGETQVSRRGRWQLAPTSSVGDGTYRLRVEQQDAAGVDLGSYSVPFTRTGAGDAFEGGRAFVVQRGDYLWRIASDYYGDGIRYTVIYDANAQAITNPDLIYPGQIFIIPNGSQSPTSTEE